MTFCAKANDFKVRTVTTTSPFCILIMNKILGRFISPIFTVQNLVQIIMAASPHSS